MTKVGILKFDLTDPDAARDFKRAANAQAYSVALWQIKNEVFRPARKHGYDNRALQELVQADDKVAEAIGILEDMFFQILAENGLAADGDD